MEAYTNLKFWIGLVAAMYIFFFILIITIFNEQPQDAFKAAFMMLAYMPIILAWPVINKINGDTMLLWSLVVWLSEVATVVWLAIGKKIKTRTILIAGTVVLLLLIIQFVGCTALAVSLSNMNF